MKRDSTGLALLLVLGTAAVVTATALTAERVTYHCDTLWIDMTDEEMKEAARVIVVGRIGDMVESHALIGAEHPGDGIPASVYEVEVLDAPKDHFGEVQIGDVIRVGIYSDCWEGDPFEGAKKMFLEPAPLADFYQPLIMHKGVRDP